MDVVTTVAVVLVVLGVSLLVLGLAAPVGLAYLFLRTVLGLRPLLTLLAVAAALVNPPLLLPLALAGGGFLLLRRRGWRMPAGRREEATPPLGRPWSLLVQDAVATRDRYRRTVEALAPGPLRTRLAGLAADVDAAVAEAWRVAAHGDRMAQAHREVDAALRTQRRRTWASGPDAHLVAESLRAQEASAARLAAAVRADHVRLQLLVARLGETVAHTIELGATGQLRQSAAADALAEQVRALRLATAEVEGLQVA